MRTSRAVALGVTLLVVAGAVVGYATLHHGAAAAPAQTRPVALPSTPSPREPVLASLDPATSRPLPAAVSKMLRHAAHDVRRDARLAGEVVDATTGVRLWASGAGTPVPPASTTKLLTAAAALTDLGPQTRLATATRRSGDTVYLVGGGDPTIVRSNASTVSPAYPRPATLSALADRTVRALGSTTRVHLRLDTSRWVGPTTTTGWKRDYVTEGDVTPPTALEVDEGRTQPDSPGAPRTRHPAQQAGAVFASLLRRRGVHVTGKVRAGRAVATTHPLAAVRSPNVATLVQRMLTVSDDDLAEALGRAVALHDHRPASFAGAAGAVTAAVGRLGIDTRGVTLRDTSGLSHRDRIPPRVLVGLLRAASGDSGLALRPMLAGLPVAGLTGTLSDRFRTTPSKAAAGTLRAKTGTLTGVNALAGTVVDRSGRLLAFAFLASRAGLPGVTVPALDRLASRLARCGCS